mmetsp:Transcript_61/g.145  ORF Transcript_61/g.145 Transcript_61/m.145 type:complete len:130 (+) Transcript_61:355-744(+)
MPDNSTVTSIQPTLSMSVSTLARQRIDKRRLKKCEPAISCRQCHHHKDLHDTEEFPIDNALIRQVLHDDGYGGEGETHEVSQNECSLHLAVVYFARPPYHYPLSEYQRTQKPREDPPHPDLPVAFHGEK